MINRANLFEYLSSLGLNAAQCNEAIQAATSKPAGTPLVCYIAHPIGGDVEENLADLRRILWVINRTIPEVVPFCPYYADVVSLDDSDPDDRRRGMENGRLLLASGIVDEFWLTGDHVSVGMAAELELADQHGVKVVDKLNQL